MRLVCVCVCVCVSEVCVFVFVSAFNRKYLIEQTSCFLTNAYVQPIGDNIPSEESVYLSRQDIHSVFTLK